MTGAAMLPFLCGQYTSGGLNVKPWLCLLKEREECHVCHTQRIWRSSKYKRLIYILLALFDTFGTLRRMPRSPKDAKKFVWPPWHSSALRQCEEPEHDDC